MAKSRQQQRFERSPRAAREAAAVALLCAGTLTLLALVSYRPADVSLGAFGATTVSNWIGPVGAVWADMLLQALGCTAFILGGGVIILGWRAFLGLRLWPGVIQTFATSLLLLSAGALLQMTFASLRLPYPPGGIAGVFLAPFLATRFARLGGFIMAASLGLLALALCVDGILLGMGWRGQREVQRLWVTLRFGGRRCFRLAKRAARYVTARSAAMPAAGGTAPWRLSPSKPLPRLRPGQQTAPAPAEGHTRSRGDDALRAVDKVGTPAPQIPLAPEAHLGAAEAPLDAAASAEAPPSPNAAKQEPQIVDARPDLLPPAAPSSPPRQAQTHTNFELPPVSLLDYEAAVREPVDPAKLRDNAARLTQTLKEYGIEGHVREIRPGPVVTMYEYVPGPGIKLSKIASLADDLAMSMEALRVRIVAPIPGKGAVGIEIPNETRETVYLKEIIAHDAFGGARGQLTMALGKDIEGAAYVADLARMPHLLVAGATGAGKSVSVNAMIMSVLFRSTPDDVRMIMVDPKMLELSVYDGIPHLLLPVVTDPKKAALALRWAVEEMERRYALLSEVGVRSIDGYNSRVKAAAERGEPLRTGPSAEAPVCERLPYLIVIVDELADLMMVASRDVETCIMRLAQMARAAGIHLILATQRPSVDVLTGVIKANFPTRIAFQVASRHDSRTILDGNGAENLLGRGDMLYLSPGAGGVLRVHGAYVSDEEIERAVKFLKAQGTPTYDESILAPRDEGSEDGAAVEEAHDEMYDQAVAIVAETRQASISMIQRRLRIGYNRAARMVERMETDGIVGPGDGAKPRDVLISSTSPLM